MTGTKVGGGYDRPSTCALCLSEAGDRGEGYFLDKGEEGTTEP